MKSVDSQALGIVNRALGLTGAGAPLTEFLDGTVDQTLDIGQLVRRGRTQVGSDGIYFGLLTNVHSGAGTLSSFTNPYDVPTGAIAPYPVPMPPGFDIWLLSANVRQESGTGTLTAALSYDFPILAQGWGVDDSGVAVARADPFVLAFWDSVITETDEFGITEQGNPWVPIGLRLRRNSSLLFSSTASALATFDCQMIIGVFPVSLGQDILV